MNRPPQPRQCSQCGALTYHRLCLECRRKERESKRQEWDRQVRQTVLPFMREKA